MNTNDLPAFPSKLVDAQGKGRVDLGMALRDYFAAKAMLGILQARADGVRLEDLKNVALDSYIIADAMLEERNK
jgi:hypothetical protein